MHLVQDVYVHPLLQKKKLKCFWKPKLSLVSTKYWHLDDLQKHVNLHETEWRIIYKLKE